MSDISNEPITRSHPLYFYMKTVSTLLDEGLLTRSMSILVVCGGPADLRVFRELGFDNVVISNLSEEMGKTLAPDEWSYQDAENLTYEDESFDCVCVRAGLHHCYSPHRALLEMFRVARRAVLVLEARDGWVLRIGSRLGVIADYELGNARFHHWKSGGVADSGVPNYVYRWTEREVRKTIRSFAPYANPRIRFFYGLKIHYHVVRSEAGRAGLAVARLLAPLVHAICKVFKSQGNLFGFLIEKPQIPRDLQPWMTAVDGRVVPKGLIEAPDAPENRA